MLSGITVEYRFCVNPFLTEAPHQNKTPCLEINNMKTGKTILISYAVAAVGCIVLAGWLFDINLLRSVAPGLPEMVINTALGFLLCRPLASVGIVWRDSGQSHD